MSEEGINEGIRGRDPCALSFGTEWSSSLTGISEEAEGLFCGIAVVKEWLSEGNF